MVFELEGEQARVVRAGEAFWDAGWRTSSTIRTRPTTATTSRCVFTVTMLCEPGKHMLIVRGRGRARPA